MRLTGPKSFHDRTTRKDVAGDDGGESKEGKGRGAVSAASDDANTAAAGECAVTATSLLDIRTPNDHALKEVLGFVPGDNFYFVRHTSNLLRDVVDQLTKVRSQLRTTTTTAKGGEGIGKEVLVERERRVTETGVCAYSSVHTHCPVRLS